MHWEYGMDRENLSIDFDTIIIGGGIVGAGIFREQSLHGMSSLIIDQADFNSQTSQGSSKMLHGGIRYLENMDFALVFEALREKNLWLKISPHLTKEIPFFIPVYKESKWPLFFLRVGLFLYDLLSLFKNSPHKVFNQKETIKNLPGLRKKGLTGSGMYFDGIVDDSKLGLECIYDGLNNNKCKALNYKKVIAVKKNQNHFDVTYEDVFTKEKEIVTSKFVIMATGPFTDQAMHALKIKWTDIILPSKGTHLWLNKDALAIKDAMVLQTKDQRIIFVIPQRNAILVGTTEIPIENNSKILDIKPTEEEIQYLLDSINEYFPEANVNHDQIISSFAAVRPLVKSGVNSSKTSRNHKIYMPENNFYVIAGGKYTTFRKMAEDINAKIFKKLNIQHNKKLSETPLRSTSIVKDPFTKKITKEDILNIIEKEFVQTKEDLLLRRLSLPSLRHLNDSEIEEIFQGLELKSVRDTDK